MDTQCFKAVWNKKIKIWETRWSLSRTDMERPDAFKQQIPIHIESIFDVHLPDSNATILTILNGKCINPHSLRDTRKSRRFQTAVQITQISFCLYVLNLRTVSLVTDRGSKFRYEGNNINELTDKNNAVSFPYNPYAAYFKTT